MTAEPAPAPRRAAPPQVLAVTPHGRSLLFTLEAGQGLRHTATPALRQLWPS